VTETIESTPAAENGTAKKRAGGLNSMLIADLKSMAGGLGVSGAGAMKKAQLVEAIKAAQSGGQSGGQSSGRSSGQSGRAAKAAKADKSDKAAASESSRTEQDTQDKQDTRDKQGDQPEQRQSADRQQDRQRSGNQNQNGNRQAQGDRPKQDTAKADQGQREQGQRDQGQREQSQEEQAKSGQNAQGQGSQAGNTQSQYDESGNRRSRRRRGRDRERPGTDRPPARQGGNQRNEPDTTILDDDVLTPAAGILDVLDNYAFVRTSGYLPGTDDVYVSLSMVRKFGLRRGDAIVGQVRQPRESERKEKFNPMVRIDSVNGADPEAAKHRVDFAKLTPLYPSERLRLETVPTNLIGRVIDIAAPIGKGQRGLIVSPSKAGKTMIMQSIANSITTNNPECHLMVVLVDERPEEVTDFERSVKGEVISSTFDRPASDHTMVAELAIERAKRLVELGHDVVVLLDGITRLGRAYNLAAPASGRILSGGVDSAALYPPKRFFGAARNIEDGGSLTILATALIESGSKMDEVIFEEFKGTGNMEIRLRRDFADKRIFPAIDAVQSGTRREELLMSKEELAIIWKLRRVLSGLDGQQALELLLERLKKSASNIEFLMQVQKTTPGAISAGD
jgi:transcription termination factor Rho